MTGVLHSHVDILWLDDPACRDVSRVGAKAANLCRLSTLHQVPPGFCLTPTALDRQSRADHPAPDVRDALAAAYATLAARCGNDEPPVAVRSSAIDEDGSTASFAGQHDTFLNVVGVDAISDAIRRCWASMRAERALAYRRRHALPAERLGLPVLVQQLILADVSAVVFSANPITGRRDELVITASWGLGESLVGGSVTPDSWLLWKGTTEIIEQRVGDKQRMTVAVPGGTSEVDTPRRLRARPTLAVEQVTALARLGVRLEEAMGQPVDIECAFAGGQLYLLQCRPISTLG